MYQLSRTPFSSYSKGNSFYRVLSKFFLPDISSPELWCSKTQSYIHSALASLPSRYKPKFSSTSTGATNTLLSFSSAVGLALCQLSSKVYSGLEIHGPLYQWAHPESLCKDLQKSTYVYFYQRKWASISIYSRRG